MTNNIYMYTKAVDDVDLAFVPTTFTAEQYAKVSDRNLEYARWILDGHVTLGLTSSMDDGFNLEVGQSILTYIGRSTYRLDPYFHQGMCDKWAGGIRENEEVGKCLQLVR